MSRSYTRPLGTRAPSQQVILDALSEQASLFVPVATIVRRLYGHDSRDARVAFGQALMRLRRRYPGLEIESASCCRVRRPI